ncbi:hypothetical protein [Bifidobacterium mongoliense]|uniref:hypothetical protein n=1 Tax=Bifidobacterium mongoliense TaxID=518643 RepID=UPI0030EC9F54
MRTTVVISARLRDEYAELIRTGKKHYEIRTEPFGEAQAIRFVSAHDGSELGIYRIKGSYPKDRRDEKQLIDMAAIGDEAFHKLFPPVEEGGPSTLWVAEIGARTTIEELIRGDQ